MILENIKLADVQSIFDLLPRQCDVKSIVFESDNIYVDVSLCSSDIQQLRVNAKLTELSSIIDNLK